jgi:hypothetical protein
MTDAAVQFSLSGEEILTVHLKGKWQMETEVPTTKEMLDQLDQHPSVKRIVFDATELGSWDSSLPIFFFEIQNWPQRKKQRFRKTAFPQAFVS